MHRRFPSGRARQIFFSTTRPPSSGGRSARTALARRPMTRRDASCDRPRTARRLLQQLLLPGRHLARVHAELAGQLGRRLVAPGRRQRHLGLERRAQIPAASSSSWTPPDRLLPRRETTPYQAVQFLGSTSVAGRGHTGGGGIVGLLVRLLQFHCLARGRHGRVKVVTEPHDH